MDLLAGMADMVATWPQPNSIQDEPQTHMAAYRLDDFLAQEAHSHQQPVFENNTEQLPPHYGYSDESCHYSFTDLSSQECQQHSGTGTRRAKQAKRACMNCQKSCKKCDDQRPCTRCVLTGVGEFCVDAPKKPRAIGIKRGPYKKSVSLDGSSVKRKLAGSGRGGIGLVS
ncbi:UNVERIFIED_CONTAM: hypothetical protein HDU68_012280 [Siphonaria sp. JEL0065]|nr:hypothetical protein HDU68_012280 [Siphonaria sp. JEL0065]